MSDCGGACKQGVVLHPQRLVLCPQPVIGRAGGVISSGGAGVCAGGAGVCAGSRCRIEATTHSIDCGQATPNGQATPHGQATTYHHPFSYIFGLQPMCNKTIALRFLTNRMWDWCLGFSQLIARTCSY